MLCVLYLSFSDLVSLVPKLSLSGLFKFTLLTKFESVSSLCRNPTPGYQGKALK